MSQTLTLPRNTTQQAEKPLYGDIARWLHRISGGVIIAFVLVHMIVQTIMHVPMFAGTKASLPWLQALQTQHWVHAVLYASIVFHTLHGLKLLVTELGYRIDYRHGLWVSAGVSALVAMREMLRYAGV